MRTYFLLLLLLAYATMLSAQIEPKLFTAIQDNNLPEVRKCLLENRFAIDATD